MTNESDGAARLVLVFVFGGLVCGVLAYAALREAPIDNGPKFFLLRVLAAVGAAGVAALVPGFLNLNFGAKTKFAISAGGAMAVFALVFLVNPPRLVAADEPSASRSGIPQPVEAAPIPTASSASKRSGAQDHAGAPVQTNVIDHVKNVTTIQNNGSGSTNLNLR